MSLRAAERQQRYGFRFAQPSLLAHRIDNAPDVKGPPLTDDSAPVDVEGASGEGARGKK